MIYCVYNQKGIFSIILVIVKGLMNMSSINNTFDDNFSEDIFKDDNFKREVIEAIEAADVVLMDDDLRKLPVAVRIARKTLGIVKQNIIFSLVVKIGIMILGALGLADMKLAVFGDVGVLVLAILNALRVHRIKA